MRRSLIIVLFLAFAILLFANLAEARGLVPCGGCSTDLEPATGQCPLDEEEPPCNLCYTLVLTHNIVTFLLVPSALNGGVALIPIVAALLFAIGGFFFFASTGSPERFNRGRTILFAAVIGVLIIYGSWLFINLLLTFFGVAGWTGLDTWWQIECGDILLLNFTANPNTVFLGDSTTLLWETGGVASCEASADWSGPKSASCSPPCSETITPTSLGSYTYKLKCTGLAGVVRSSALANVIPYTFTASTDFQAGELIGVTPNNDQLELLGATEVLNFIWVAASGRGTIVKVNTVTGEILGEYVSAPDGRGRNPSRTTVDNNGNVWTGNRDEATDGKGSVVQIGLKENNQCRNGGANTSTGLGDVKPWTNADADGDGSGDDTLGGVSTAQDDCIIKYVRVDGNNVRHVSVDANNNVWTGGAFGGDSTFNLLHGGTGASLASFDVGCGGYGGLVDGNGVLWSALHDWALLRYDTKNTLSTGDDTWMCLSTLSSYGLGIDNSGNVWNNLWGTSTVRKFHPAGSIIADYRAGKDGMSGDPSIAGGARGVVVGPDDNVWVANSVSNTVTRLDNNGNFIATVPVGAHPTGVAVDKNGFIWATNLVSHTLSRIDPATNAVDKTVDLNAVKWNGLDAGPYNYSDMTGSTLTGAALEGTWRTTVDSNKAGAQWGKVKWTATVPPGSSLIVNVEVSEDAATWSAIQQVTNDVPFSLTGRYLRITVNFKRSPSGESPVLLDLQIERIP